MTRGNPPIPFSHRNNHNYQQYQPMPYNNPYNNNPMHSPNQMMPALPEPVQEPLPMYPQLKQHTLAQIVE